MFYTVHVYIIAGLGSKIYWNDILLISKFQMWKSVQNSVFIY